MFLHCKSFVSVHLNKIVRCQVGNSSSIVTQRGSNLPSPQRWLRDRPVLTDLYPLWHRSQSPLQLNCSDTSGLLTTVLQSLDLKGRFEYNACDPFQSALRWYQSDSGSETSAVSDTTFYMQINSLCFVEIHPIVRVSVSFLFETW